MPAIVAAARAGRATVRRAAPIIRAPIDFAQPNP